MIRIAVCDDEDTIINQIENILMKTSKSEGFEADIDVFSSGEALEKAILSGNKFDLIYLDIQMPGNGGIKTAGNIRRNDENVLLIFVTGYEKYAAQLFQFNVLKFIKKPIDEADFIKGFLEANRRVCSGNFHFSFKHEEHRCPYKDILYFESLNKIIAVHTINGEVGKFYGKLSDTEAKLKKEKVSFLRIHQSYLVNYHSIKTKSKIEVTLINGVKLPVSEDRQKKIRMEYMNLMERDINV